ncbi:MAG: HYC_CC_PP family protein [Bacteroidota bacterium]
MKIPISKIHAIVMAFLVIFSTFSFSVEKHFCGTMLVDIAFFSNSEACGSEAKICEEKMSAMGDSCCTDQKMTVEGQDELKVSFYSLDLDQQVFLKTLAYTFIYHYEDLTLKEVPFEHYSPPLLVADIQILDQVFLI